MAIHRWRGRRISGWWICASCSSAVGRMWILPTPQATPPCIGPPWLATLVFVACSWFTVPTPASRQRFVFLPQHLVHSTANAVRLRVQDGKTPADLATEHGHSDIAELLTRATWDRSHAKQAITREAETAATESNPLAALLGTPRGDEPRATTPHYHVGRALLASALTPRGTHKRAASSHARHASGGATPAGATATAPVGLDEVNLSVATPGGLGHETDYQRRERSGKNTSQWTDRHAGSFQAGAGRSPRHGDRAESPAHRTVQLLPPPRRASTRHHQDAMQRRHVV